MVTAFDIETFCPLEELKEDELLYLKGRKDYSCEEDFYRELATNPYVSLLISFSLFYPSEDRAEVYYLSKNDLETSEEYEMDGRLLKLLYKPLTIGSGLLEAEGKLLNLLWEKLERISTLITFHGRDFDLEFLRIRTIFHALKPHAFFLLYKSNLINIVDLKDIFRVGRRNYSLNFIAKRLNLPIDKGDMDGSRIREVFLQGNYRSVAQYNLRDALITGMLYEKFKDYLQGQYALEALKSAGFMEGAEVIEYALDRELLTTKETSALIDLCCKSKGATKSQKDYLLDLIKGYKPELSEVCSLLSHDTLMRIVRTVEGERS
ncbi:MAG: ribonuclease H-like domain-containing protein [Aquificaceae bacterium]|nr:ribonuclease H-like domain-containing protein [Aquificaceae bacterium]